MHRLFGRKSFLTCSHPQRYGRTCSVSHCKLNVCKTQNKFFLNSDLNGGEVVAEVIIFKLIALHSYHRISSFIFLYVTEKFLLICCSVFISIMFQTSNASLSKNVLAGNRERQVKGCLSCKLVKPHNLHLNGNHIL